MNKPFNIFEKCAVPLGIVGLFALACYTRAGMSPLADEIDFTKPIEQWLLTGPQRWGMWHSPIYPWILYGLTKWLGFHVGVERAVGFLSVGVGALFALLAFLRLKIQATQWKINFLLALMLLSPIALGSSLILDYDNTILLASFSLYCYALVCFEQPKEKDLLKQTLIMGCILGICLLSKETTPLIFPIGLFVTWQSSVGWRRSGFYSCLSGLIGIVVFTIPVWSWCVHYQVPFSAVFEMDLGRIGDHTATFFDLKQGVLNLIWTKISPAFWLGLPLCGLFLWKLKSLLHTRGAVRGITVIVLSVLFIYTFVLTQKTFHFPKYMAPVLFWVPWLILVNLPKRFDGRSWLLPFSLVFLISYFPGPMSVLYERSLIGLLESQVLYILLFVFWLWLRNVRTVSVPDFYHFTLILVLGLGLSYTKKAIFESSSITYWYGESAIEKARTEAKQWVYHHKSSKQRKPLIISPAKDIAWALRSFGGQYIDDYQLGVKAKELCSTKTPIMIVTRRRESTALDRSPYLSRYLQCLNIDVVGKDLLIGTKL